MTTPQPAMFTAMGDHQWYVHLSRVDGADLQAIKMALTKLRSDCSRKGINLVLGFGPTLLQELTNDVPADFQPFEVIEATDDSGRVAAATQEELLLWLNGPRKDQVWKTQWDARQALKGHMAVARETITFIYGESLDMTGFIDGTGNPAADRESEVAVVPDGEAGAGGSFILAQRWVHDLEAWEQRSVEQQEQVFGRTKSDSIRLGVQAPESHLSHVELRQGSTADASAPKRDEIVRRSTPYAFHDGSVGLYFMAFCRAQAPLRERLRAMYGVDGQVRDSLTTYTSPVSGSFYFAPSTEILHDMLA